MRALLLLLLALASPASAVTPQMMPMRVGTTDLVGASSSVCGVSNRYFGSGAACNATETSVDVTNTFFGGQFVNMSCTQTGDATCTLGFTLRVDAADVSSFYCESVNGSTCTPTAPVPTTFVQSTTLYDIMVTDVGGLCGTNAPTCTMTYRSP